jgi:hypothetical protein
MSGNDTIYSFTAEYSGSNSQYTGPASPACLHLPSAQICHSEALHRHLPAIVTTLMLLDVGCSNINHKTLLLGVQVRHIYKLENYTTFI